MNLHRIGDTAARVIGATAVLALMGAGLAGCVTSAKTAAEAAPAAEVATSTTGVSTTTTVTSTSPTTRPPAPTTVSPAPTTTVSPVPTTAGSPLPGNAAGYIHATYDAWAAGDRAAAERVAEAAAVDSLFARIWSAADEWVFLRCEGAAGSVFCVWQRPGEQLLIKARNTPGGEPVNAVEFRASP